MESPVNHAIIDEARIKLLQDTIGEKLVPIITLYFKDCSEKLDHLRALIHDDRADEVGKLAHQMKGAALSIGFVEIQNLFMELESDAKRGHPLPHDWHSKISTALQRTRAVISERFPESLVSGDS